MLCLYRCDWIHDCDGNINPLLREDVEKIIQNVVRPMASAGLSTICLAYKNYVPGKVYNLNIPENH